jgi:hypothetical protein
LHFEIRYSGASFNPEHIIDFGSRQLKSDTLVLTRADFAHFSGGGSSATVARTPPSKVQEKAEQLPPPQEITLPSQQVSDVPQTATENLSVVVNSNVSASAITGAKLTTSEEIQTRARTNREEFDSRARAQREAFDARQEAIREESEKRRREVRRGVAVQ